MKDIGVTEVLLIIAAILAVLAIFEARGRALVAWAVLLICFVLLVF